MIEIFMPTSVAPWHPSTDIIEKSIESVRSLCPDAFPIIYCDHPPPWCSESDRINYHIYLDALERLQVGRLVKMLKWSGLPGMVLDYISRTNVDIFLNYQHDWEFLHPERVDTSRIVWLMDRGIIQIVRFHKRKIVLPGTRVDTFLIPYAKDVFGVPLIATNGWGDSCHFATVGHYKKHVIKRLKLDSRDGRYGMEGPVLKAYRRDIERKGFEAAHKDWGSYLYGCVGDETYITHLGGEATKWRQSKGFDR